MNVAVSVDLVAPVDLAALVSGSDTMAVSNTRRRARLLTVATHIAGMLHSQKLDLHQPTKLTAP